MTSLGVLVTVLATGVGIAAWGAVRRIGLWRRGQPATVPIVRGLLAVPRRYLVNVHDVVARDRFAATFHAATAGGLVVIVPLVGWLAVRGGSQTVGGLLLLASCLMAFGTALAWRRRQGPSPSHLSGGEFRRLPWGLAALALAAFGTGLSVVGVLGGDSATTVPIIIFFLSTFGTAEVLVRMTWGGPMEHAFAGAMHLAFHPRPARFAGGYSISLRPAELGARKLGVEQPVDFRWNQLLGFDACVQCGRCELACPAFAAGQPLNPKKLIQDLVVGFTGPGTDIGYSGSPHPSRPVGNARGGPGSAIVPELIEQDTIWACTTCRACVHECPMMIEHVDAIVDLRRFITMENGSAPHRAREAIDNIRLTDTVSGRSIADRLDWAGDLELPLMVDRQAADVLLWVGEAAFDAINHPALRATARLMKIAGVDFAVLGQEEADCGDLARRLGDDATFQEMAHRNVATLSRYRFGRIVTTDPHVLNSLRNEYPAFGGNFIVQHHTSFLAELLREGRLTIARPTHLATTYHDPCYLARYNGEVDGPRAVLKAIGVELREMDRSGFRARCCGAGGGAAILDVPGRRRIPDMRIDDAKQTGAEQLAVACPNCAIMLKGATQTAMRIADVAELLLDAVELRA